MRTNRIIAIAFVALAACGTRTPPAESPPAAVQSPESDPKTAVAKVGGQVITLGELDAEIEGQLQQIRSESEKKIFQTRRSMLERMIIDRILGAKAKEAGKTLEEYIQAEVEKAVPPASDEDIAQFYADNVARMEGKTLDEMKDQISAYLVAPKQNQAAGKLMDDAKASANVEILLEEPLEPRVEVAAIGPSKGPDNAPITIIEFSDFQ